MRQKRTANPDLNDNIQDTEKTKLIEKECNIMKSVVAPHAPVILVVEDDPVLLEAVSETLKLAEYKPKLAQDILSAKQHMNQSKIDCIVLDVNLKEEKEGLLFLKYIKQTYPDIPCVIMTAYGNIRDAVQAMREGAVEYLVKPFAPELLIGCLKKYIPKSHLIEDDGHLISQNKTMQQVLMLAKKAAMSGVSVLLQGESGTGKEVLAKYIHQCSERKKEAFVAINCAAIPETMLEATLFGYEKGAYTGAYQASAGKFELAQNGTLLLDEISEMSCGLQAKLLRVLQEKEVERVGGKKQIALDVRMIATTNRNLNFEIEQGRFRSDLFYRLSVFPIIIPPLRDRKEDIVTLAESFLRAHKNGPILLPSAKEWLINQAWPGNVRELQNFMYRLSVLHSGEELNEEHCQSSYFLEIDKVLN